MDTDRGQDSQGNTFTPRNHAGVAERGRRDEPPLLALKPLNPKNYTNNFLQLIRKAYGESLMEPESKSNFLRSQIIYKDNTNT